MSSENICFKIPIAASLSSKVLFKKREKHSQSQLAANEISRLFLLGTAASGHGCTSAPMDIHTFFSCTVLGCGLKTTDSFWLFSAFQARVQKQLVKIGAFRKIEMKELQSWSNALKRPLYPWVTPLEYQACFGNDELDFYQCSKGMQACRHVQ